MLLLLFRSLLLLLLTLLTLSLLLLMLLLLLWSLLLLLLMLLLRSLGLLSLGPSLLLGLSLFLLFILSCLGWNTPSEKQKYS